jgi:dTDP-4-dehydrorhamnose reductase
MKILMTGGSGLLGREILKLDETIVAPPSDKLNVCDRKSVARAINLYHPSCILHLAAKTHPPLHEKNPRPGIDTNIIGTANVAYECSTWNIRLVYLSTDYVYSGMGPHTENEEVTAPSKFVWSKLGGECSVAMLLNSLIIRCSFGTRPFPWDQVYAGQRNSKLYVDEIAPMILKATKSNVRGILNIGGEPRTLEEYAKQTKPDITTIPKPDWVPEDTSLNLKKWQSL